LKCTTVMADLFEIPTGSSNMIILILTAESFSIKKVTALPICSV